MIINLSTTVLVFLAHLYFIKFIANWNCYCFILLSFSLSAGVPYHWHQHSCILHTNKNDLFSSFHSINSFYSTECAPYIHNLFHQVIGIVHIKFKVNKFILSNTHTKFYFIVYWVRARVVMSSKHLKSSKHERIYKCVANAYAHR